MIVERVVNTHYHSCPKRQDVVGECNDGLCRYFTWHLNHHTTHRQNEYSESRLYGETIIQSPLGQKRVMMRCPVEKHTFEAVKESCFLGVLISGSHVVWRNSSVVTKAFPKKIISCETGNVIQVIHVYIWCMYMCLCWKLLGNLMYKDLHPEL